MKFSRLLLQFLCVTFCFTCSEKEVTPRTYARIQTLSVDNITPEGARFTAEITFAGQAIEEHGFLWSVSSSPLPGYNSDIIKLGAASSAGKFSVRAERSLAAGKVYYMRAYLKAGGKLVLGNVLEFKSLGSRAPRITSVEPLSGFVKDTVRIRGENFSNRPENVRIMFGDKIGESIQISDTLLVTRVPVTLATELSVVSVTITGNSGEAPEKFRLIPPQTHALSANEVAPGDTLTISGSNFNADPQYLLVYLNNESCTIVSNTAGEIKVIVPFFRPTSDQVSLKVVSSNLAVTHSQPLTYIKPTITSIEARANIYIGDTLRLRGKYIFPATLTLKFAGKVITPVSAGRDHIDFAVPKDIQSYANTVQVSFGQNITDYQTTVALSRPVITAVTPSPATFNEEIVITGKNFHHQPGSNFVSIAGVSARVIAGTTESLTVKIPSKIGDCTSQNTCNQLSLNVLGQTALPTTLFSLRAPVIESVSPTELTNGVELTVNGKYFDPEFSAFNLTNIDGRSVLPAYHSSTKLVINNSAFNPTPLLTLKKQVTIKVANSNTYPVNVNLKGAYTQKAKTPATLLERTNLSKAVAGNRAFIGLGHHTTDGTVYSDFYEYNADNDQWTQLADFPGTVRQYPVAFALGDYVYVGMGLEPTTYDRLADMWRYSITSGTWQQIQDFPGTPKYDPFVFIKDNKAYIGGGASASLTPTLEFWSFDGSVWQQKNNLPEYHSGPSKCFVDNYAVYLFFDRKLYYYALSTDSWRQVGNFPSSPQATTFTGGMIDGRGFLWTSLSTNSTMQKYNPGTNAWQTWQTPLGIFNPDSFIVNKKLYIFLGYKSVTMNGMVANDYVWEFDYTLYPQ